MDSRPALACAVFAGLALSAGPPPACAWHGTGHMTIADIAYDRFTPAARARVDALAGLRLADTLNAAFGE